MILPTKHLSLDGSLLGAGAIILKELNRPQTVSRLWDKVRGNPSIANFARFSLTLDFLYSIDTIDLANDLLTRKGGKS